MLQCCCGHVRLPYQPSLSRNGRSRRVDLAGGDDISSTDAARDRHASTVFQDFSLQFTSASPLKLVEEYDNKRRSDAIPTEAVLVRNERHVRAV
jgi:hypothetical protein